MRGHTVDAPAQLREALRMRRDLSPAALAAGLLLMARAGELPTTPRLAVLGLDTFFDDLDAADWADLLPTAQALAHHWGGDEPRMATVVLASHHGHEPAPPPPGRDPGHEPTSRDETPTAPPPAAPPAQRHTPSQPPARDETALVPAPTLAPRDETPPAAVSPHRQAQCGRCGTVLPAPASTGR